MMSSTILRAARKFHAVKFLSGACSGVSAARRDQRRDQIDQAAARVVGSHAREF